MISLNVNGVRSVTPDSGSVTCNENWKAKAESDWSSLMMVIVLCTSSTLIRSGTAFIDNEFLSLITTGVKTRVLTHYRGLK